MSKRLTVLVEGDDDQVLLAEMLKASLLPVYLEPKKAGSNSQVVQQAGQLAHGAGLPVLGLIDEDDKGPDGALDWFESRLQKALPSDVEIQRAEKQRERVLGFCLSSRERVVRVAAVSVGLSHDPQAVSVGCELNSFALDDYLAKLLLEKDVYERTEAARVLGVPHGLLMKKLDELRDLFASNKLPIQNTKRVLMLARATLNWRASPAVFAEHLVESAVEHLGAGLRDRMQPLAEDIEEAAEFTQQT